MHEGGFVNMRRRSLLRRQPPPPAGCVEALPLVDPNPLAGQWPAVPLKCL